MVRDRSAFGGRGADFVCEYNNVSAQLDKYLANGWEVVCMTHAHDGCYFYLEKDV